MKYFVSRWYCADHQWYDDMTQDINNVKNEQLEIIWTKYKTNFIQINMSNQLVFKGNNQIVETVNQIKYLGFIKIGW